MLKYFEKKTLFFITRYVENSDLQTLDRKTGEITNDVSIDEVRPTMLTNLLVFSGTILELVLIGLVVLAVI